MTQDPAAAIAAALIAPEEGYSETVYHGPLDPPGVWTIGLGFTFLPDGSRVTAQTPPMPYADAVSWLTQLAGHTCSAVRAMCHVPVTDNQVGALGSFAYEEGLGALTRSALLRDLNAGDVAGAEGQFDVWDVADGHVVQAILARREREKAKFMEGLGAAPAAPYAPPPQPAPEDEADVLDAEFNKET